MSKLSAATPREIGGSEHKVEADSMKISTAPQTRDKDVKYWSGQLAETKLSSEHWRTLLQSMCAELNVSENDFAESMNSAYQQVAGGLKQRDVKSECNKTTEMEERHVVKRKVSVKQVEITDTVYTEPDIDKSRFKRSNCCAMCNFFLLFLIVALALSVALLMDKQPIGTFNLINFFTENPESADQWEKLDRRSIHILVTGKTGTGKSALINGLMGANVTKEGDTLDPTTAQVEQIKQMVHGISMSVFDSPGLQDGTRREDEYLRDMERKCQNVDLVLYTIKLTDQRVHVADTNAMRKLTDAFGDRFWERAMFVMTFANEVLSPEYPEDEEKNQKYFESRLKLWKEKLPEIVEERADIPLEIAKHVPVVPAGYYKTRDLPGRKYWFSKFWMAALNRILETSAEGAGYMLEFTQDRLKNYDDMTEEDFRKPIHEQPILKKIVDE